MFCAMLTVALAASSPATEALAAIPSTQLVRAAESAYAELRRISDLTGPDRAVDDLIAPLATVEREVDQLRSEASAARAVAFEGDYVEREVAWKQAAVRQWDDQLSARVQQLDAAAGSLHRLVETWRLTAASLDAETPPPLVARAGDVRDRAAGLGRLVRKRMSDVLELQDRVATVKVALSAVLATLADADAAKRRELFEIESTPLWRRAAWSRSTGSPGIFSVLAMQVRAALAYAASRPAQSAIHLALAAALIVAGLTVTRRLRPPSAPLARRSVAAEAVTRYPVESALLMSIFATPLIHPAPPPGWGLLMDLAGLVPVVRIAGVLAPAWRRPVRWIAALFVMGRMVALAPQVGVSARMALIVGAIAASTACAAGFRRAGWLRRLDGGRWKVPIVAAAGIAAVLFAVSAGANVVGNVRLAELLSGATLASLFGAAALAVVVAVASGALRILLELPASRRFRVVRDHEGLLIRRLGSLLRAAAIVVWFLVTLRAFHATQSFREAAGSLLRARMKVGGLDLALGDVVAFAVTLWIAIWLSRALKFALDEVVLPSLDVRRGSAAAISTTAKYAVIGVGFGSAVLAAGVEMTRFTVLAGTLGVGIGFGLQNVVNNFVSGLILLYEQPVQVGDIIELGQLSGEVRRIGVRSSTVRTPQGADVIVPNSNFISAEVVNWTGSDRSRRVDIALGVAYGTAPGRVVELLLATAKSCTAVASVPQPVALFTGFGESALQFELRVWTVIDNWVTTASELRTAINDALPRAGVVLAFPKLDVWLRSAPPGTNWTQVIPGVARPSSPKATQAELLPRR